MKIVAVIGSPRKDGSSTKITEAILKGAREAGHEIREYRINEMNIMGCQACRTCKENGIDCVLDDDLKPYWKDLHEADLLIVSAPNYCSQVCGPMITYMNRHFCIISKDGQTTLEPGKTKLIGVFAQGGPVEAGNRADQNYDWFLGDFLARKTVLLKKIVVGRNSDLDKEIRDAYELGRSLS